MKTLTDYTQYVNNKLTKKDVIAPVESSSTASQAYTVGKKFFYNNILYKATADIAQGGLIVPNTNCTPANIIIDDIDELGSQIQTLTNQIENAYEVMGQNGAKNKAEILSLAEFAEVSGSTISGNTVTYRGVTFTFNDDKTITVNGTASQGIAIRVTKRITGVADIILNGCPSGGSASGYQLQLRDGTSGDYPIGDYGVGRELTLDPSHIYEVMIVIRSDITVNNLTYKPMVRDAKDTDDTFQPYAKTNQQLTQDTTGLLDNLEVNGAVNLLNPVLKSQVVYGITVTNNDDGTYTLNGSSGSSTGTIFFTAALRLKAGYSYKGVAFISGGTITGRPTYTIDNRLGTQYYNIVEANKTIVTPEFRIEADVTNYRCGIWVPTNATFNDVIVKPMVILASIRRYIFVPYVKSNKELTDDVYGHNLNKYYIYDDADTTLFNATLKTKTLDQIVAKLAAPARICICTGSADLTSTLALDLIDKGLLDSIGNMFWLEISKLGDYQNRAYARCTYLTGWATAVEKIAFVNGGIWQAAKTLTN